MSSAGRSAARSVLPIHAFASVALLLLAPNGGAAQQPPTIAEPEPSRGLQPVAPSPSVAARSDRSATESATNGLLRRLDAVVGRPVRRAFVPAAEPRAWPAGSWTPMPTERFLQTLQNLPDPRRDPDAPPVRFAIYALRWDRVSATSLVGHFVWILRPVKPGRLLNIEESDLVITALTDPTGRPLPWGRDANGRLRLAADRATVLVLGKGLIPVTVAGKVARLESALPAATTRWIVVRTAGDAAISSEQREVAAFTDSPKQLVARWTEVLDSAVQRSVDAGERLDESDSGGQRTTAGESAKENRDAATALGPGTGDGGNAAPERGTDTRGGVSAERVAPHPDTIRAVRWLWQALSEDVRPTVRPPRTEASRTPPAAPDDASPGRTGRPRSDTAGPTTTDEWTVAEDVALRSFFFPPRGNLALVMTPAADRGSSQPAAPLLLYRQQATWDVQQTSVDVVSDFSFELVGGPVSSLRFAIPSELRIFHVRLGDTAIADWTVATTGDAAQFDQDRQHPDAAVQQVLTVRLPEPISDGKFIVRVEGTRPLTLGGIRRLDGIRPLTADREGSRPPVLLDGRLRLVVAPELELGALQATALRQLTPLEPFEASQRTEFQMLGAAVSIALPVYPPRPRLQARQWTLLRTQRSRLVADAVVEWTATSGQPFTLQCAIGQGWIVRSVRRGDGGDEGAAFDWQVSGAGTRLLQITTANAIGDRPERFHVRLTTTDDAVELPPLTPRGARIREHVLGIASDLAESLQFLAGNEHLERLSAAQAEQASTVLQPWLPDAAGPVSGSPATAGSAPSQKPAAERIPEQTRDPHDGEHSAAPPGSGPRSDGGSASLEPTATAGNATAAESESPSPAPARSPTGGPVSSARDGSAGDAAEPATTGLSANSTTPRTPPGTPIAWWRLTDPARTLRIEWRQTRPVALQAMTELAPFDGHWRGVYRFRRQRRGPMPSRFLVAFSTSLPDDVRWQADGRKAVVRARRISQHQAAVGEIPPDADLWEVVLATGSERVAALTAVVTWPEFPDPVPLAAIPNDPTFVGYVTIRVPRGGRPEFQTSNVYQLSAVDSPAANTERRQRTAAPPGRQTKRTGLSRWWHPGPSRSPASTYHWTYRSLDARITARWPADERDRPVAARVRVLAWLTNRGSQHDLHRVELQLDRPVTSVTLQLPSGQELIGALLDGRAARIVRADGPWSGHKAPGAAPNQRTRNAAHSADAEDAATTTEDAASATSWTLSVPGRPDQTFATVELHLRADHLVRLLDNEHRLQLPHWLDVRAGSVQLIALAPPGVRLVGPPPLWNASAQRPNDVWWRRLGGPLVRPSGTPPFRPWRLDDWRRLAGVEAERSRSPMLHHPLLEPFADAWNRALRNGAGYAVGGAITAQMASEPLVFRSVPARFVLAVAWALLLSLTLCGLLMRALRFHWRHIVVMAWAAGACVCIGLVPDAYAEWAGSVTLALVVTVLCPRSVFRVVEPPAPSLARALASTVAMHGRNSVSVRTGLGLLLWILLALSGSQCVVTWARSSAPDTGTDRPTAGPHRTDGRSAEAPSEARPAETRPRGTAQRFDLLIPLQGDAAALGSEFRPTNVVYLSDALFKRLISAKPATTAQDVLFESADFVVSYDPELNVSAKARFTFSVRQGRSVRLPLPLEGLNPLADTCRLDGRPVPLQADPSGHLFWQSDATAAPAERRPAEPSAAPAEPSVDTRPTDRRQTAAQQPGWTRHILSVEIRPALAASDATGRLTLPFSNAAVTVLRLRSPRDIHWVEADAGAPLLWHAAPDAVEPRRLKAVVFRTRAGGPWTVRWFADIEPPAPELRVWTLDDCLTRPTCLERTRILRIDPPPRTATATRAANPTAVQISVPADSVIRSVSVVAAGRTEDVPFSLGPATSTGRLLTAWLPTVSEVSDMPTTSKTPSNGTGASPETSPTNPQPGNEPAAARFVVCRFFEPYRFDADDVSPHGGRFVQLSPQQPAVFVDHRRAQTDTLSFASVRTEPAYRIVVSPADDAPLPRLPPEELQMLFGALAADAGPTAFRLLEPTALAVDVVPVLPEKRISVSYIGQLDSRQLTWTADADIVISGAAVFHHEIDLDPALEIDTVSVTANDAEQVLRWTRMNGRIVVHLRNPAVGTQTLPIRGHRNWSPGRPLALPLLRLQGARVDSARLRLYAQDDIVVRWADAEAPSRDALPDATAPTTDAAPRLGRQVAELDVSSATDPPRIVPEHRPAAPDAELLLILTPPPAGDAAIPSSSPDAIPLVVAARVRAETLPGRLAWVVPEVLSGDLRIEAAGATVFGPTRTANGLQLVFVPETGVDTVTFVLRTRPLPVGETLTLPLPRFTSGNVRRTTVVWSERMLDRFEPRLRAPSGAPVPTITLSRDALPQWLRSFPDVWPSGESARAIATDAEVAGLAFAPVQPVSSTERIPDGMQCTWLYLDGNGRTFAETLVYVLHAGPTWRLKHDADPFHLDAVTIDGRPVDPHAVTRDRSGHLTLSLAPNTTGLIRTIRLVWSSRIAPPLIGGVVRLPTLVSAELPADRHVTFIAADPAIALRPVGIPGAAIAPAHRRAGALVASLWLDIARSARQATTRAAALAIARVLRQHAESTRPNATTAASTDSEIPAPSAVGEDDGTRTAEDSSPVPPPLAIGTPGHPASGGAVGRGSATIPRIQPPAPDTGAQDGGLRTSADAAYSFAHPLVMLGSARSIRGVVRGLPPRTYYWTNLSRSRNVLMFVLGFLAVGGGAACRRLRLLDRLHRWPGAMWLLLGTTWWACFVPSALGLLFMSFGLADLTRRLSVLWANRRRSPGEPPSGLSSSVVDRFPGL
ncbi:MAG: hypothetical protein D6725_10240 [Planctomycetota bacterium]|nr:MAG: hypothetical protein D6725_10240 [Planctomycetota bacterium]